MTPTRALRALTILFGLALLPAGLMSVNTHDNQPIAILANDTPTPLKADKPSNEELANLNARRRVLASPEHFRCLDIDGDKMTPENTLPDGNVTAAIAPDSRTGSHEVVSVDYPKIVIGHRKTTVPNGATGGMFSYDEYNYSFQEGVEPYAVFVKHVDDKGNVTGWGRYALTQRSDGAFTLRLRRGGDVGLLMIVATDTKADLATCEAGNDVPDEMWRGVARLH